MLYTNSSASYPKLSELMKALSVPEETIDVMTDYLDTSKPRRNELLDMITPVQFLKDVSWQTREDIEKAVSKDIVKGHDAELYDRFIIFVFRLFKSTCHFFIPEKMTKLKGGANVFSPKEHFAGIAGTLTDILGEDAKAASYAIHADYAYYHGGTYRVPQAAEPSVCRKAFGFLNSRIPTPGFAKNYYACAAILLCYILEQENGPLSDDGKWAVETVEKLWEKKNGFGDYAYPFMLCAAAEAAPYSEKAAARFALDFEANARKTVEEACGLPTMLMKVFAYIEADKKLVIGNYIAAVAKVGGRLPDRAQRLERLAKEHPAAFKHSLSRVGDDIQLANDMGDILRRADPTFASAVDEMKEKNRFKLAESVSGLLGGNNVIKYYILGKGTLEEVREAIKGRCIGGGYGSGFAYYKTYGADEYLARAVTVMSLCSFQYGSLYRIERATGFMIETREAETFGMYRSCGLSLAETVETLAKRIEDMYDKKNKAVAAAAECTAACPEELEKLDIPKLSATGRIIAVKAMGSDPERFRPMLIEAASDGSKAVRAELAEIIAARNWHEDVTDLLKAKKSALRELALDIIGKQDPDSYKEELSVAFESEKSDKIKARIGALIGLENAVSEEKAQSADEQIAKLAKSAKTGKLSFLFGSPLKPVRRADGSGAPEDTVRALIMCYAGMTAPARSRLADDIAASLDSRDLEILAADIFGRWLDNGAQAKHKAVLYFCAIHGGLPMTRDLMHYIKDWAEAMRGAIAAEAVRAMALSGSSEALMNVDNMSRKFKNKQVRSAAAEALSSAAETLGITTEELADRIVPDLGFDKRLCRVFDYGKRQFSVYLKPSLELEVFAGEKQIKTLPKPGASDDKETAEAAFNEFKEMKKQLKNVVAAQKSRLEYVLMCDRKWSSESWRTLFVGNAVMHCFAVGLIWGVYENGALKDTFRYMDDGSFTDAEGDEYTFPEGAQIGLVHPLELTSEQIAAWQEQLSDFELTQPFDQLGRKVFTPDKEELPLRYVSRLEYAEINSLALVGKMSKLGWYKGQAEDAGFFYYFYREDIRRRTRGPDGSVTAEGFGSMLLISGASAAAYDFEGEEVTLGKLVFFKAGKVPDYYDKEEKGWLEISEVSPRYFSETLLMLDPLSPKEEK